jgi:chromosome partitioning protein
MGEDQQPHVQQEGSPEAEAAAATHRSITCSWCGTQLPGEANFCLHCGLPTHLLMHLPVRRPARVYAIANQKRGAGKTTTAINLAACLADAGRRTLIVDLDPQCDATTGVGLDNHHISLSTYELLLDDRVAPHAVLKAEIRPNLSLLPAKVDLTAAEFELVYIQQGREFRLKRALDTLKPQFDFMLIDCPSSLGPLTINALSAAYGVLLPLPCEYFALEGMVQLLKTIHLVRRRLNPRIALFGVVLTMFDPHTELGTAVVREVSEHFPKEKFRTLIPRNERLAEAPSYGQTILEHAPLSPAALAYKELAEEVIERAAMTEAAHA